jgi:inorganic pyrophosphatase
MGSKHPDHGFIYPINYGYVPDTKSGDGEEIDVYLLGEFNPIQYTRAKVIAVIEREDDVEQKLVAVDEGYFGTYTKEQIWALVEFREKEYTTHIHMHRPFNWASINPWHGIKLNFLGDIWR